MRLTGDPGQLLTIDRSEFGPAGTPGEGDLLLNVTVRVGDYSAAEQAWVLADDWRGFIKEMQAIETSRKGQAKLLGASPDVLELRFKVTDRAGHMAVAGFLGWNSPDGFYQKCQFGFAFDASLLSDVVRDLQALGR